VEQAGHFLFVGENVASIQQPLKLTKKASFATDKEFISILYINLKCVRFCHLPSPNRWLVENQNVSKLFLPFNKVRGESELSTECALPPVLAACRSPRKANRNLSGSFC
jgi:hypothetical protein